MDGERDEPGEGKWAVHGGGAGVPSAREDASEAESQSEDTEAAREIALVVKSASVASEDILGERGERRACPQSPPGQLSYIDGG